MLLQDHSTLAEAQAFPLVIDKKQIGSGQARGFFVSNGIWTTLRQIQTDMGNPLFALADAVIVTASDASSFFGLDTNTAEGVSNLTAANTMVAAGLMTESQKVELLALSHKTTYPHAEATQEDFDEAKDAGEVIPLLSVIEQHKVTIRVSTKPRNPTNIFVEHRYGPDDADMTEWHRVGTITNVEYTQRTSEVSIPASPTAYRELRLVSPLTLGVSIV
jgi:hypothetical protein